jgi:hypothetical protein
VSPVKYELGFYIPEDDILHSHCRESLNSYIHHLCSARPMFDVQIAGFSVTYTSYVHVNSNVMNCGRISEEQGCSSTQECGL